MTDQESEGFKVVDRRRAAQPASSPPSETPTESEEAVAPSTSSAETQDTPSDSAPEDSDSAHSSKSGAFGPATMGRGYR